MEIDQPEVVVDALRRVIDMRETFDDRGEGDAVQESCPRKRCFWRC